MMQNSGVAERRRQERQACDLRAACSPYASRDTAAWSGRITDLACGGLRLAAGRRFEQGTVLKVEVPAADGDAPVALLAKVVHVGPRAGGGWVMGCQLTPRLAAEDVEGLLQTAAR